MEPVTEISLWTVEDQCSKAECNFSETKWRYAFKQAKEVPLCHTSTYCHTFSTENRWHRQDFVRGGACNSEKII